MSKKTGLFIFEKREVWILFLLAITIALFAFTLGVHLGKSVGGGIAIPGHPEAADATPLATSDEQVPDRVNLTEQSEGVDEAVTESLNKVLHEEVANTGIKLNVKRQVDLPSKPVSPSGGATTLSTEKKTETAPKEKIAAPQPMSPSGKYTIQVGSFPTRTEALKELHELEGKGVNPFMKQTKIQGKGEWYRIYLGGYNSKKEAETIAQKYLHDKVIESFIVANMP